MQDRLRASKWLPCSVFEGFDEQLALRRLVCSQPSRAGCYNGTHTGEERTWHEARRPAPSRT